MSLDQSHQPALAEVLHDPRGLREARHPARRAVLDPDLDGAQVVPHQLAQVLAQPAHPRELEHVGQLVQHDPAEEAVAVDLEVAHRLRQVRRHEKEPRRLGHVEEGDLVLAEHALGHVADYQSALGGHGRAGHDAKRSRERPRHL